VKGYVHLVAILAMLIVAGALWAQQRGRHPPDFSAVEGSDWSQMVAAMEKMHDGMKSVRQSRDPDVDFVRLMLPHHEAAIDMAKTQLMYGRDPQIRRLAQEIITDQQSEIELMQLWLKQHQPH
jgi:uncharacterized protein (DUF305 family)